MPPAPTLRIATTRLAVLRSDHLPEIATTVSHLLAVRAAYASGAPAALILEDDAWIPHGRWQHGQQRGGLAQLMTTLEQQRPDWRVVQLYIWAGLTFATRPQELRRLWQAGQTLSRRHVLSHYEQWGATAYLISRRGMQRLLEAFHVVVSNPGMSMSMSMNMDLRTPENLLPLADLLLFAVDGGAGVFTANRLIFAHRVLSYGPSGTHTASANEQLDLLRHFVYFGDLGGNLLLELVATIEPFMPTLVFFLVICLALADGVLSVLPTSAGESKLSAEKRKALPHRRPAAALAFDTASCEPPSLPLPTRLGWAQTLLVMTVSWLLSKTVLRVYNALYLVHIGYPGSGFESHAPKLPSTYSQHICLLTATCVLVRRHPSGAPLAHALLPDITNAVCCTLVVLALQPLAASVLGSVRLGTSVAQNVLICSFAVHASLPVASGLLYLYAPRGLQQHAVRLIRIIQTARARAVIGAAAVAIIYIIKVVRMQSATPLCLFHLIEAGPAATIPVAPAGAAACTLLASVLVSAVFPRASSLRGRN